MAVLLGYQFLTVGLGKQIQSADVADITVKDLATRKAMIVDRDHFAIQEIRNKLKKINLETLDQDIIIQYGIPDIMTTAGTFARNDKTTSASRIEYKDSKAIFTIFLDESITPENKIEYEINRNYYWLLLALDTDEAAGQEAPDYTEARRMATDLTMSSSENDSFALRYLED